LLHWDNDSLRCSAWPTFLAAARKKRILLRNLSFSAIFAEPYLSPKSYQSVRYFIHIGYNGYSYRGWQRQSKVLSVQEVLETNIRKLTKEHVHCHGCGRTDAQVHASQYFFHMDLAHTLDFDLKFRLNKMLAGDIAVFDIIPVEGSANAQLDVLTRTYDYFIHTLKDPFLHTMSSYYPIAHLDLVRMQRAAQVMELYKDYSAFCLSPLKNPSNICEVSTSRLSYSPSGERIWFQITANRFLKGMVRNIVQKLLDIGCGELSLDEFESYLRLESRPRKSTLAYPQGLYLSRVTYPYLDIPPRIDPASIFLSKAGLV